MARFGSESQQAVETLKTLLFAGDYGGGKRPMRPARMQRRGTTASRSLNQLQIIFSQVASRPLPTHRTTPAALNSRSARAIVGRLTAGRARSRSAYRNSLGRRLTTARSGT